MAGWGSNDSGRTQGYAACGGGAWEWPDTRGSSGRTRAAGWSAGSRGDADARAGGDQEPAIAESQLLAIGMDGGRIEVHSLKPEYKSPGPKECRSELEKFLHYVSII